MSVSVVANEAFISGPRSRACMLLVAILLPLVLRWLLLQLAVVVLLLPTVVTASQHIVSFTGTSKNRAKARTNLSRSNNRVRLQYQRG
jgi:hypothetical protein